MTFCDVVDRRRIASGHLLAASMYVSKCVYPFLDFGNSPTKSMYTLSDGHVYTSWIGFWFHLVELARLARLTEDCCVFPQCWPVKEL